MLNHRITWIAICRFRLPCEWRRVVRTFDDGIFEEAKHSKMHIKRLGKGLGMRGVIPTSGRAVGRGECLGCHKTFATYRQGEEHRDSAHPGERVGVRLIRTKG